MKKFKVDIAETYKRTVYIEAETEEEAQEFVEDQISEGSIDLPRDGGEYEYIGEVYAYEIKDKEATL